MSKLLNVSKNHWLLGALVLCFAARLSALLVFGAQLAFEGDVVHGEGAYDVRARNLLTTGVLGLEPGQIDVEGSSVLYPVLLAVAYAVRRTHADGDQSAEHPVRSGHGLGDLSAGQAAVRQG
jgi:hypothetical protein